MVVRGSGTDGIPPVAPEVFVGISAGEYEVPDVVGVEEVEPEVPGRFTGNVGPAGDTVGVGDRPPVSDWDSADDISHF